MQKIPRCMSTQHPDNVQIPFFATENELGGDDEIYEAYYAFSHLGCDEQMWDCEGKEVDNYVVKKLLTKYENFFRKKRPGKDLFITPRVPNPTVERAEAKILLETLESIPRSFDAARIVFQDDIPPIFEVILPMTSSARCLDRIYRYYKDFVVGKQDKSFRNGDITVAEWIGEYKPHSINVIPLYESMEQMLNSDAITGAYLKDKDAKYQRVFLARSDPALNYGIVSAVLINKIALFRLRNLSRDSGVKILPILGVGSVPFRGNLTPHTVDRVLKEYPGVHTFTIQSAFKYDYMPEDVSAAIKRLKERHTGEPAEVDEARCMEIINKYSAEYMRQVVKLAPVINEVAKFVPRRRKRKLHIGLFGYFREVEGINLPRAISFTSALYSVGLPPELLGLNALDRKEIEFVRSVYVNFDADLRDAFKFFNKGVYLGQQCPDYFPQELKKTIRSFIDNGIESDREHNSATNQIITLLEKRSYLSLEENILRAAYLRKFLG
ncbi:MAG: phosphoenolpyruvate carboxylase [Deltaproteobacteria bacterium]|nr:phosphoenolpyruvate carboxylase [Deltaproteobacteria bacterium]